MRLNQLLVGIFGLVVLVLLVFFLWRSELQFLIVEEASWGQSITIQELRLDQGGYVVVSPLDRYGQPLPSDARVVSDYLLPGRYEQVVVSFGDAFAGLDLDSIQNQSFLVRVFIETRQNPTGELFFGSDDRLARDWLGRSLQQRVFLQ